MRRRLLIGKRLAFLVHQMCLAVCSIIIPASCLAAEDAKQPPKRLLPVKGEVFAIEGRTAFLILPETNKSGGPIPWVWYAPTLPGLPGTEEKWMFQKILDAGIAVGGIDVGESYGSPAGRALFSAFYRELTEERGLSKTPCLLARSRGGLMLYNWAVEHPSAVACIAGIYPVCDLSSCPGVANACGAYGLTAEQLTAQLTEHNPIDRLKPLAEAQVPIYHIHGDSDAVVPIERNSGELAQRYKRLGGKVTLNVIKGQGHTMWPGWFECQELADFLIAHAHNSPDDLEQGFKDPPDSAKPRTYWFWLNGNITKEGITTDLEWMRRAGLAGFHLFDGGLSTPLVVSNRLAWMTPEWKDALRHAASEADRLGLEMVMAACGGWSETGGPWVKPDEAMKKLVWSETIVQGPQSFSGLLPPPPTNNGRFQQMVSPTPPGIAPLPSHYADVKVLACRLPEDEVRMMDLRPRITTSSAIRELARLTDGNFNTVASLPLPPGETEVWVQFEFAKPYRARALTIAIAPGGWSIPKGALQCSDDGVRWSTLLSLPGPAQTGSWLCLAQTETFPETSARFYRVVLRPAGAFMALAELELSGPRINRWHGKAAFFHTIVFDALATPPVAKRDTVARQDVLDLTARVKPDGVLEWDAPPGKWVLLRLGWSLTGQRNAPATQEARGFEVDKLSARHVGNFIQTYADMLADAMGPYFGKSCRYLHMDSWEAQLENWTDDMIAEFQRRRGYDPTPFLPAMTGRVIESAEVSDGFLWDFRRTLADLVGESHYGLAAENLHRRGLGLYAEALGGPTTTGDGLLCKRFVDVPMGEFWTPAQHNGPVDNADLREAASAAHIYGKTIVAAESFTTDRGDPAWAAPAYLKTIGDNAMALGVNRFVFHTCVHQPFVDDQHKPGITLGPFGQHYTRHLTWAEQAIAFNTYLARASYLMQQGRFVGDLAYFYGEGAPVAVPGRKRRPLNPAPPAGYSYDWINADVLLNGLSVKDGRIVLPSGMSYQVLVVPDYVNQITLPLLRKLRDLVSAGATVVAPRPVASPSLADYGKEAEFRSITSELWGSVDGDRAKEHGFGKGKVFWGQPLEQVLAGENTPADFEYSRPEPDSALAWIHRRDGDTDLYFVANQRNRAEDFRGFFRVAGKEAELWHPDTGVIEPADYRIADGRTRVPLRLGPYESVFVVFRRPASAPSRNLPRTVRAELAAIPGPWQLSFPPNSGAPPRINLDQLVSWTHRQEDGVKYFSGTATYTKEIEAPPAWFETGSQLLLDLGKVREIAEVSVNGKPVGGILWKPPFQTEVTAALRPGRNRLEVKVVNLWPNRIIGDQQPNAPTRLTWLNANYKPFTNASPLLESGLLGPVRLLRATNSIRSPRDE